MNNIANIENYVELKHINKNFGDFKASNDVSFLVKKGQLVGLLGSSGSGKTTILRILAGLETPDSGEIYIGGKLVNKVPASKRGIGFVFQSYALFRYKTVFDNIAFGLVIEKRPKSEIKERVNSLIELVGLKGMEKRYPNQLSGGQRQRVAFARALAVQPNLLLLDEPFAAIDAKVRQELRSWLKQLIHSVGITSIFVTHDQEEAIEVADQIIITNHGKIEQVGTPIDVYQNPTSAFVAQFIGSPTIVNNPKKFRGFEDLDHGVKAIIRPEFISISKDTTIKYVASSEEGVVENLFFRGSSIELKVEVKGEHLTVNYPLSSQPISVGEKVDIFINKMFQLDGDKAFTVHNLALANDNSNYII
ncbi:MAG: ABC transporter ATP-binding protein [Succinivibrionaceae bacterium]